MNAEKSVQVQAHDSRIEIKSLYAVKKLLKILDDCMDLAQEGISVKSDDDLNTEVDIYSKIRTLIEETQDITGVSA